MNPRRPPEGLRKSKMSSRRPQEAQIEIQNVLQEASGGPKLPRSGQESPKSGQESPKSGKK